MRHRLLYLFIGIGILCCCGLVFFFEFHPQDEIRIKKVTHIPDTDTQPTTNTATQNRTNPTLRLDTTVKEILRTRPLRTETEKKEVQELLEILASEEYQEFLNIQYEKWGETYKKTGTPNFSFQEFFDFFHSRGMQKVNLSLIAHERFREYFPTGKPKDYDAEMAARFQEIFLAVPGTPVEAQNFAFITLSEEPDFAAWTLGRFKGEIGQQLQWIEEQVTIASTLETPSILTPIEERAQEVAPIFTDVDIPHSLTSTETVHTHTNERPQTNVDIDPSFDASASLSPARLAEIRQTLQQYGTSEGMMQLLETDTEGFLWMLDNFESPDDIDRWMSEKLPTSPPRETEKTQVSTPTIPKTQETHPWNGLPE